MVLHFMKSAHGADERVTVRLHRVSHEGIAGGPAAAVAVIASVARFDLGVGVLVGVRLMHRVVSPASETNRFLIFV